MSDDMTLAQAYEIAIDATVLFGADAVERRNALVRLGVGGHLSLERCATKHQRAKAVLERHRALVANAERLRKAAERCTAGFFMEHNSPLHELSKVLNAIDDGWMLPRGPQASPPKGGEKAERDTVKGRLADAARDVLNKAAAYWPTSLYDKETKELRTILRAIADDCEWTIKPSMRPTPNERILQSLDFADRLGALEWNYKKMHARFSLLEDIAAELKIYVARQQAKAGQQANADCICANARRYAVDRGHGNAWHCPVHGGQTFIFQKDYKGVHDESHK